MSILNQVVSKKVPKPLAVMVFSERGLGKTTFPMTAPKPIYVTCEENDEYEINRLPKVETLAQWKEQLKAIRDDKHDYKTLVLDTMDTFEKIVQKTILVGKDAGKTMVTAKGGYNKAYDVQAEIFTEILNDYIKPIRDKRKMNIVLLSHADKIKHEDPITSTSYDSWLPSMHKKHRSLYENWVSVILFLSYDLNRTIREDDSKIILDSLDGKRVIYTEERPSHAGKNRFQLPYEIPFELDADGNPLAWGIIAKHVREYYAKNSGTVDKAEKDAELKQKELEQKIKEPETQEPEKDEADSEPDTGKDDQKEPPKDDEKSSPIIGIQKQIDELWAKVPQNLQGSIQTAISRAVNKQDEKEMTRILTKIKSVI